MLSPKEEYFLLGAAI